MDLFTAILLGIVQGFTEFLPVSSSAHLIFFQALFPNFSQQGILFDVFLHGGTLLAIIYYFRKTLLTILTFRNPHLMWTLIVGTLPAFGVGYLFADWFEAGFSSVFWAAVTLLVTGAFNWIVSAQRIDNSIQGKKIGWGKALLIGVFQAVAIIPGISRSSATIFAGVVSGIDKRRATEFSFLLSIPAIFGALVFELAKYGAQSVFSFEYFVGFVISALVGYWSIGFLLKLVVSNKYKFFAYYCWLLGLAVLFWQVYI